MSDLTVKTFDSKLHVIYLSGCVDEEMYKSLNEKLIEINAADNEVIYENEAVLNALGINGTVSLPKIVIYLSTYGGSVYDGLAIYDLLKNIQKLYEIEIICTGKVMSMGIPILLSIDKAHRFATTNATFMIHQISTMAFGTAEQIREDLNETDRLDNILTDIIVQNTKITKNKMKDIHEKKKDWYFNAEEAVKYQLVSAIL